MYSMAVPTFTHKSTFRQFECLHFFLWKKKQTSPHSQTQNRKRKGKNFDNTFSASTEAYKEKEI